MTVKMVLFDLDGTLLPMDQDEFTNAYFKSLAAKLMPHGYEPKELIDAIWAGTAAMIKNTGAVSNEQVFWNAFYDIFGEKVLKDKAYLEEFYQTDFHRLKAV